MSEFAELKQDAPELIAGARVATGGAEGSDFLTQVFDLLETPEKNDLPPDFKFE